MDVIHSYILSEKTPRNCSCRPSANRGTVQRGVRKLTQTHTEYYSDEFVETYPEFPSPCRWNLLLGNNQTPQHALKIGQSTSCRRVTNLFDDFGDVVGVEGRVLP